MTLLKVKTNGDSLNGLDILVTSLGYLCCFVEKKKKFDHNNHKFSDRKV